jgi:hypothetical protein
MPMVIATLKRPGTLLMKQACQNYHAQIVQNVVLIAKQDSIYAQKYVISPDFWRFQVIFSEPENITILHATLTTV